MTTLSPLTVPLLYPHSINLPNNDNRPIHLSINLSSPVSHVTPPKPYGFFILSWFLWQCIIGCLVSYWQRVMPSSFFILSWFLWQCIIGCLVSYWQQVMPFGFFILSWFLWQCIISCLVSYWQRVMPSGFFILLRFFMRVDNVMIRVNDTRLHYQVRSPPPFH